MSRCNVSQWNLKLMAVICKIICLILLTAVSLFNRVFNVERHFVLITCLETFFHSVPSQSYIMTGAHQTSEYDLNARQYANTAHLALNILLLISSLVSLAVY